MAAILSMGRRVNITVQWRQDMPLDWSFDNFCPRPNWPSGIVVACVCPSVSPSVRHQVCPRDNPSPVQARITKFGPYVQKHLVMIPIVMGVIDLDLQGEIWLEKSNFLVSSLLEIYNHYITTREPWVPRLLHRLDCFMVSILCKYLYT